MAPMITYGTNPGMGKLLIIFRQMIQYHLKNLCILNFAEDTLVNSLLTLYLLVVAPTPD